MTSWHTALKPQTFQTFVYNSSLSDSAALARGGNVYNSWSKLITAKDKQAGGALIVFEQNETIPSGAWNLNNCYLKGNGLAYSSGGYTLTFGDSTTITDFTFGTVDSLRILSTSTTDPIITITGGLTLQIINQSELWASATKPIIKQTGSGQMIFLLRGAGRLVDNGYEVFETTASSMGSIIIIARGDSSTVADDVLRSSNNTIFGHFIQSTTLDPSSWTGTQTNLSVGANISAKQTISAALGRSLKQTMANATSITPGLNYDYCRQDNTQAAGTLTVNAPTGTASDGDRLCLLLKATNAQTYSFNAIYRGSTTTALPTTLAAGKSDWLEFRYNSTDTKYDLINYRGGF